MAAMTRLAKIWVLVAVTTTLPAVAIATDLKVTPAPKPAAPISASPLAPPEPACLEWTDGCRTCQRSPAGETSCSNVGIACAQQAPRCTRR